jgi:hypothetical protein
MKIPKLTSKFLSHFKFNSCVACAIRRLTLLQMSYLQFSKFEFKKFVSLSQTRPLGPALWQSACATPYQSPTGVTVRTRRCRQLPARAPRRTPPPPAAAHARRGKLLMPTRYSSASLSSEASYTPMHVPAIKRHPRCGSRAHPLRRTPLAPPRANTATIHSSRRSTPRASPLALV